MRHLFILVFIFGLLALPATAQTSDSSVFVVTDVPADVTADSAAHARDKAILQAQRSAFDQLLDRLGADKAMAAKLSDDDLATLVQNFEVQSERTSSVRYLGTFTVQFRPNAVRHLLGLKNARYTETRSKPLLILPILQTGKNKPVLWEEVTRWREAWDTMTHGDTGLVPVMLPAAGLDDISLISTDEAYNGKTDALHTVIDKYHTGGAVVVILHGDLDKPSEAFSVDILSYDDNGMAIDTSRLTVPAPVAKTALDETLGQAVKLVRGQLEKNWRAQAKETARNDGGQTSAVIDPIINGAAQLPVLVPIARLGDLAQVKQNTLAAPGVLRVDVISLARGAANIQIVFHGTLPDLQNALRAKNLNITQDPLSGNWVMRPAISNEPN